MMGQALTGRVSCGSARIEIWIGSLFKQTILSLLTLPERLLGDEYPCNIGFSAQFNLYHNSNSSSQT